MISKTVILFVFGATIASAQFVPRLIRPTPYDISVMPELRSNGCPPATALAPMICQFMQPNMGLNYKPALIAPSTYIPPLVVEKCDKPQLEIELPARKPIVIPEAPILPPITVPKFPVPVLVEKPMPPPMPIVEPCEPVIADMSFVSIPEAPALPPLEMPALPVITEQHGAYLSEAVLNELDYQSMMIPHAPELPAFAMPELSISGVETAMVVEHIPEYVQPLKPVPAAPELPPVRLPEILAPVPPMIIERPIEEPCITGEIVVPQPAPMIVAKPPRIPVPMPILPAYPEPAFIADPCEPILASKYAPYFVGNSPYIPAPAMGPGFLPARSIFVKENMNNFAVRPLPHMRRI